MPAILFLLWPLAEISGFIIVGKWLGLFATLALIVATTLLGLIVLRSNGISILTKLRGQRADANPETVARTVLDGTAQVFGGLLLIFPGFISDILGLLLLIPLVRSILWDYLRPRIVIRRGRDTQSGPSYRAPTPGVIDLDEADYHRETPKGDSPWNKPPHDGPA
ncbi:FxsA family protein [Allorhizobium sp. BGMRC 0089]|nr:FxsA family protein [Allorhizobium sonneratiae]